jgi:hypothetical protein
LNQTRSKSTAALYSLLLLLPLLLLIPAAGASTRMTGSGTFNATATTFTTVASYGGYTLYYAAGPDVFTGILTGTGSFTLYLLVSPSGAAVGMGTLTCPCVVDGQAGTFYSEYTNHGTFGGSGVGQNPFTVSGGQIELHGTGTFQYVSTATGFTGPYQWVFQFGP